MIQIATGIFLAMHYSSNIELAFSSVEHIMRDVNGGWLIRYMHANGASFFFICLYIHIGKALYYGSYKAPRTLVWTIGVIIFIATIATAFMGYCLVYGQMSHWGATVITNLLSAIPFIGGDLVPLSIILPLYLLINYKYLLIKIKNIYFKYLFNLYKNKSYIHTNILIDNKIWGLIIGFIDGDGYIRVTKKIKDNKNYIYISLVVNLNIKDQATLEYFYDKTKIGKIFKITVKNKKLIRWEISKTDLFYKIIPILNDNKMFFLTETRQKQYLLVKYIFINKLKYYEDIVNHKENIQKYINSNMIFNNFNKLYYFNNWLVGFTMAEGSFVIKRNQDICFQLKQKYNFKLFEDITKYFNTTRQLTINKNKYIQFGVSSIKDIQNIINFFSFSNNHPLLGDKLLSYNNWLLEISKSSRYKKCKIPYSIINIESKKN